MGIFSILANFFFPDTIRATCLSMKLSLQSKIRTFVLIRYLFAKDINAGFWPGISRDNISHCRKLCMNLVACTFLSLWKIPLERNSDQFQLSLLIRVSSNKINLQ